jgi:hypothetical protein
MRRSLLPPPRASPEAIAVPDPDASFVRTDPRRSFRDGGTQTDADVALMSFPFQHLSPFDGIIAFLTLKCGGNVCVSDLVRVTASSLQNLSGLSALVNVVDFKDYRRHCHTGGGSANQWICMDFKIMRVVPTHYSLQLPRDSDFEHVLTGWIIDGSETGASGSWFELDRRNNVRELDGRGYSWSFRVANPRECRFVRLVHQKNTSNSNFLVLGMWELFGTLRFVDL